MPGTSVAGLLLRLVLSLGVVIGVMAVLARVAKGRMGRGLGPRVPGGQYELQVVARQQIGKNASVLLVRAGDKGLLLGVTEHSVSLIQETEVPPVDGPAPTPLRVTGTNALQRARELTVRRA